MLWTDDGDKSATPEDTEIIEPADDFVADDESPSGDDVAAEDDGAADDDDAAGDVVTVDGESPNVAAASDEESEEYGESRYARKSRHLPSIEADHGSPSTGSGLRNAIIGAQGKRGDGS
jgi:hypothetical protein